MSDKVDFVITDKKWNDEFENVIIIVIFQQTRMLNIYLLQGLKENPKLKFINGDWLEACATRKKLIAYEPYAVLPRV